MLNCIEKAFAADAVVVQCGADSLSGDPLGSGNLTGKGLGACVSKILELNLPTLFLGGGKRRNKLCILLTMNFNAANYKMLI